MRNEELAIQVRAKAAGSKFWGHCQNVCGGSQGYGQNLCGKAPLRRRSPTAPLPGEPLGSCFGSLPCKGLRSRAPPAAEKAVSRVANGRHSFYYRLFGDRKHKTALRSPLRSLPLRGNAAVAEHKRASARAVRCGHRKPDGGCAVRRRRRGAVPCRALTPAGRQGVHRCPRRGRCLHRPAFFCGRMIFRCLCLTADCRAGDLARRWAVRQAGFRLPAAHLPCNAGRTVMPAAPAYRLPRR